MIWLPILASVLIIAWAAYRQWFHNPPPDQSFAAMLLDAFLGPFVRWFVTGLAILVVWLVWALASPARAHEADTGFRYDGACCSDKDCRPADPGEVKEAPGGWLVVPSGIFIPHGDLRLHDAPDGRFHVCNRLAGDRASPPWCVYVPSFGS